MAKLSRRIPAHTKTITVKWCAHEFATYDDTWRKIRGKSLSPMSICYWCKRSFDDGEVFALVCIEGRGNKVICEKCAESLEGSTKLTREEARRREEEATDE